MSLLWLVGGDLCRRGRGEGLCFCACSGLRGALTSLSARATLLEPHPRTGCPSAPRPPQESRRLVVESSGLALHARLQPLPWLLALAADALLSPPRVALPFSPPCWTLTAFCAAALAWAWEEGEFQHLHAGLSFLPVPTWSAGPCRHLVSSSARLPVRGRLELQIVTDVAEVIRVALCERQKHPLAHSPSLQMISQCQSQLLARSCLHVKLVHSLSHFDCAPAENILTDHKESSRQLYLNLSCCFLQEK
mmetsp:Transcript_51957/g.161613  ORF Transcript_51957/g.161613 Transcript_51957/m.161613 type:complete len:249 (-) Transcript_51957:97-843(-)